MSKYNELKKKLESIIVKLESDDIAIDDALVLHEEASKVIADIEQYLNEVEQKISKQ